MKFLLFLSAALPLLLAAAADTMVFRHGSWEMTVDSGNGSWRKLTHDGKTVAENPSGIIAIDIREEDGKLLSETEALRLEKHHFDSGELTLHLGNSRFMAKEVIRFGQNGRLARQLSFCTKSPSAVKFRGVQYNHMLPPRGNYFVPGTFFFTTAGVWSDFSKETGEAWKRSGNFAGLNGWITTNQKMLLTGLDSGETVIFTIKPELDHGNIRMMRHNDAMQIQYNVNAAGWCEPGVWQEIDPFFLETASDTPDQALKTRAPEFLKAIKVLPPADRPEWVADAAIYGLALQRHQTANFKDAAGYATRVKELGFNTIWTGPVQAGNVGYLPSNFYVPDIFLGSWAEYRAMIDAMKKQNIRTLQDIVPHGGQVPAFDQRLITEAGNMLHSRPANFQNPSWNNYMAEVSTFYSKFGIAGFRIDAPGNPIATWQREGFPEKTPGIIWFSDIYNSKAKPFMHINEEAWQKFLAQNGGKMPALGYPRGSIMGVDTICHTIRNASRKVSRDNAMLAESHGLPASIAADMTYDLFSPHLVSLMRNLPPGEFVRRLSLYLEEQKLSNPPGALTMRFMISNDHQTGQHLAGPAATRAITSVLFLIQGVPMVFDTFDFGHGAHIRRLNEMRGAFPALRRGEAFYTEPVSDHPMVFTVLRREGKECVLGLVNFSPEPVKTTLTPPPELAGKQLFDLYSGVPAGRELLLPPYGTAVIGAKNLPCPEQKTAAQTASDGVKLSKDGTVNAPGYVLGFNLKQGMIDWMKTPSGETLMSATDLLAAPGCKSAAPEVTVEEKDGAVRFRVKWNTPAQTAEYTCLPDKVQIKLSGGTLLLPLTDMRDWQANGAETLFEDFLDAEFAAMPPLQPSFQRTLFRQLPIGDTLLFESRFSPLDPLARELRFFSAQGDGLILRATDAAGDFELYRRFAGTPGLHAQLISSNESVLECIPTTERLKQPDDFRRVMPGGKITLTAEGQTWKAENEFYTLRLSRAGGRVMEFIDRKSGNRLLCEQELELKMGSTRLLSSADYETALAILPEADGALRLRFTGELRNSRLHKTPIEYAMEYRLDETAVIAMNVSCRSLVQGWKAPYLALSGRVTSCKSDPYIFPLLTEKDVLMPQRFYQLGLTLAAGGATVISEAKPQGQNDLTALDDRGDYAFTILRHSFRQNASIPAVTGTFPDGVTAASMHRCFPVVDPKAASGVAWAMYQPDPSITRNLNPLVMEPGSWNLTLRMRGERLRWELGRDPAPVEVQLFYTTTEGETREVKNVIKQVDNSGYRDYVIKVELTERAFAPNVRVYVKPAGDGGRLLVERIALEN